MVTKLEPGSEVVQDFLESLSCLQTPEGQAG